jgi:CDP-glycerol glycerophosphotransferase (TagB/SpsB family)
LTAKVYIYSAYSREINFYTSGNAILFNLWHGIGIKKIEFLIDSGPLKKIFERRLSNFWNYPWHFRRPNYVLSTSPYTTENFFAPAFRIKKEHCLEFGYPRCDIFFLTQQELIDHIRRHETIEILNLIETIQHYNETYIYLPTWRDTAQNFVESSNFDFEKLNAILSQKNALFLVKFHVNTSIDYERYSKLSNLVFLPGYYDIYPILPFTSCLITDYSSIYYDYLLLNKPVILFPFDYEQYITKNRGLQFSYDTAMLGEKVFNFDDLLTYIAGQRRPNQHYILSQINKFWDGYKGNASANCVHFLKGVVGLN